MRGSQSRRRAASTILRTGQLASLHSVRQARGRSPRPAISEGGVSQAFLRMKASIENVLCSIDVPTWNGVPGRTRRIARRRFLSGRAPWQSPETVEGPRGRLCPFSLKPSLPRRLSKRASSHAQGRRCLSRPRWTRPCSLQVEPLIAETALTKGLPSADVSDPLCFARRRTLTRRSLGLACPRRSHSRPAIFTHAPLHSPFQRNVARPARRRPRIRSFLRPTSTSCRLAARFPILDDRGAPASTTTHPQPSLAATTMEAELPRSGRASQKDSLLPSAALADLLCFIVASSAATDSYFGIVSSAQEAHAILEASKLGVSRPRVLLCRRELTLLFGRAAPSPSHSPSDG